MAQNDFQPNKATVLFRNNCHGSCETRFVNMEFKSSTRFLSFREGIETKGRD